MWFEVDKEGLGKLLERKGKAFVMFELIQNALDEDITRVDVTLERVPGTRSVRLTVEDDSPSGFVSLRHSFTLFAQSYKKADAGKRGRFDLGEKLVLALCDEAEIRSTKGGVRFDASGRHAIRAKRAAGSVFTGTLKMTNEELAECGAAVRQILVPAHVQVVYNGTRIPTRTPIKVIEATLPTEIGDEEGRLRRTSRKTVVEFYEPLDSEVATLFELGIPVVATCDRYHVNVQQKVPLNLDRDNVTAGYLAAVRALAVEHMAGALTTEDANSTWVRDALQTHGEHLPDETVSRLADLRFGDRRVAYDPSDREANSRAVAAGYQVVHGSQLSKAEWDAVKRAGAIRPAGQVTPSPKPFSPNGEPLRTMDPEDYTPAIRAVIGYAQRIARRLLGIEDLSVVIASDISWPFRGAYGHSSLTLNLGRLGHNFFEGEIGPITDLLVHEFAHESASDHLSDRYHGALTKLAGQLVELALKEPAFFDLKSA